MSLRRTGAALVLWASALAGVARADDAAADRKLVAALERSLEAAVARVRPAYCAVEGGSGVIVSPDGWVVTNHHVVSRVPIGTRLRILCPGPRRHWARLVGQDIHGDIALCKIEGATDLPHAPLGDSAGLVLGQQVIALGNPYSYIGPSGEPTVTFGVVSAVHRYEDGYSDAIQTDAPVNPGNSGGPLCALDGTVIGINGRVAVRYGNRINSGVGYAIPAQQIRQFWAALTKGGPVDHGYPEGLGLNGAPAGGAGARVGQVVEACSAFHMGFRPGDLVVRAAGLPVWNADRLRGVVGTFPAGARIEYVVRRPAADGNGTTEVTLAGWLDARSGRDVPPNEDPWLLPAGPGPNDPWLGLVPGDADGGPGVPVLEVTAGSPSAAAGIVAGDRLLRLAETALRAAYQLGDVMDRLAPDAKVPAKLRRADGSEVTVDIALVPRGNR